MQLEIFPNGPRIISEYSVLAGEDWRKRREKMEKQDDFNYVIIELKGDDVDNNALERRYEVFKKKYEQLITYIFSGKADEKLEWLVCQTKTLANKTIKKVDPVRVLSQSIKDNIPELISHIFAVWTLKNS